MNIGRTENLIQWVVTAAGVVAGGLMLAGCPRVAQPVVGPNPLAIEQAKQGGGLSIDPSHRDANELLAIETGLAERPVVPNVEDVPGAIPPAPEEQALRKSAAKLASIAAGKASTAGPKAKKRKIRAVAVPQVKGAPGAGNRELTKAMRSVLQKAGWPVRAQPGGDTLTVSGSVEVGLATGGQQSVRLAWTVSDPSGDVLGTIRQANNVPAGSVDQGFGANARHAAQAAASGIFDLVMQKKK